MVRIYMCIEDIVVVMDIPDVFSEMVVAFLGAVARLLVGMAFPSALMTMVADALIYDCLGLLRYRDDE